MKRLLQKQFARFVLVGGINTVLDFSLFNILLRLHLAPIAAGICGTTVAMTVSYLLNGAAVFNDKNLKDKRKMLSFICITVIGVYVLQYSILYSVQKVFGGQLAYDVSLLPFFGTLSDQTIHTLVINMAKAVGVLASLTWNYFMYKHFVYKPHKPTIIHDDAQEEPAD